MLPNLWPFYITTGRTMAAPISDHDGVPLAELSISDIGLRDLSLKDLRLKLEAGGISAAGHSSPLRSQPLTARARRAVPFIIGVSGGTASGKTVRTKQLASTCAVLSACPHGDTLLVEPAPRLDEPAPVSTEVSVRRDGCQK